MLKKNVVITIVSLFGSVFCIIVICFWDELVIPYYY